MKGEAASTRSSASRSDRSADGSSRLPDRALALRMRRALSAWFALHRRDLPWRVDRDPYRVWVSEAMLQQTRVEVVIPYYVRFLERFASVEALAQAPLDEVLAAWSGLGYYRRARTLHAAARVLVDRHAGRFPSEREVLLDLPGIGPYTAGAIASIAFDRPEALVDGNVARVFCRSFGLEGALGSAPLERTLWRHARALVPEQGGAGDWNQALMELGALVCTPAAPRCELCPLARDCRALRERRVAELPQPKLRPAPIAVELRIAVVHGPRGWLLEQRAASGRMAELWQFPTIEVAAGPELPNRLFPASWPLAQDAQGELRPLVREEQRLGELRHTITRHRIRAAVVRCSLAVPDIRAPLAWIATADAGRLALSGLTRKVLSARFLAASLRESTLCA